MSLKNPNVLDDILYDFAYISGTREKIVVERRCLEERERVREV